ncbi:hypothetical protein EV175_002833 [Coemansia sp. RSA 1933]|nr:hypothetical protein EV175_002833 [Coemansia sp. RSA 1933]
MFVVVEFKRAVSDKKTAYAQIIDYTRNLFANQPGRRFAWALCVCGTEVRACLLHHSGLVESTAMDLSGPKGRRDLVSLLVYWSFCDVSQLGYDPTVRISPGSRVGEIDCFDGDDMGGPVRKQTYDIVDIISAATSTFGRHTRCFLANPQNDKDTLVVIKGSWSLEVNKEGDTFSRFNELKNLQSIDEKLKDSGKDIMYSKAVMAGSVRITCGGKESVDNTKNIFGPAIARILKSSSTHNRIVLDKYGEHLKTVRDENELVVVLADAMNSHNTILEKCGILHRDISDNNILAVRGTDLTAGTGHEIGRE